MPADERIEAVEEVVERSPYAWFLTLWPLAIVFHLAGNDGHLLNLTSVGVLQIPFLIAALVMLFRPTPITAAVVAATHVLVVSAKLPVVGNHEILLLLVHIGVLIAVLTKDKRWLPAIVPALRWVLLIAYSAIAFSKLNDSFVDRAVSCAVVFGDEFGEWVNVSVSNSAALSYMVIAMTLLFELSIPIMLMVRPLRRIGIVVGMVFHTLLALEPSGHVFDFTSVLFLLFLLFLEPDASRQLDTAVQQLRHRLGTLGIGTILAVMAVGNLLMSKSGGPAWLFDFPIWCAFAFFLFKTVVPTVRSPRAAPQKLVFRVAPGLALVVLLASLNAVSPYLELRTAGAFNMYSNLAVNDGGTNHFLLPGTLPLRDAPRLFDYSPIAGDPMGLDFYEEAGGFVVPESNIIEFARTFPATADYQVEVVRGEGASELITLGELATADTPRDGLVDKVLFIRAIDPEGPTECRRFWGPAN